jgi:hypothetical protein
MWDENLQCQNSHHELHLFAYMLSVKVKRECPCGYDGFSWHLSMDRRLEMNVTKKNCFDLSVGCHRQREALGDHTRDCDYWLWQGTLFGITFINVTTMHVNSLADTSTASWNSFLCPETVFHADCILTQRLSLHWHVPGAGFIWRQGEGALWNG